MNNSLLYHAWGLYTHKCTREEYKGDTMILHVEAKDREKECPKCGHRHLVKKGFRIRDFNGLPIGGKKVIIRMKVQRYKCKNKDCDYDRQEKISFATGSCGYTHRFAKYIVDLLRGMALKDTANLLGVSWDTVKEIHTRHLENHYAPPSLEGVESIGIDEFAVRKGHVYKTRLDNALDMNKPLSQAYYLKEQLREIWAQINKEEADKVMLDWIRQAQESKVLQQVKMAAAIMTHRTGILAWYDCHITRNVG